MTDSLITGPAARFTSGLLTLVGLSLYGIYLAVLAMLKNPVTLKGITLSITGRTILAIFLQLPLIAYLWIGYTTGLLK